MNVKQLRERYEQAKADLGYAERKYRLAEYDAEIAGEDTPEYLAARAELEQARLRCTRLTSVIETAMQKEAEAADARDRAAKRERTKRINAQLKIQRDSAQQIMARAKQLANEFRRCMKASETLFDLWPAELRTDALPFHILLGPEAMRDLIVGELYRVTRDEAVELLERKHALEYDLGEKHEDGSMQPMDVRLEFVVKNALRHLDTGDGPALTLELSAQRETAEQPTPAAKPSIVGKIMQKIAGKAEPEEYQRGGQVTFLWQQERQAEAINLAAPEDHRTRRDGASAAR